MRSQMPKPPQGRGQTEEIMGPCPRPTKRPAEVVVIGFKRGERTCLLFDPLPVSAFGYTQEIIEVSFPGKFFLARFGQTLGTISAQCLKQTIAQALLLQLLDGNEGFIDELFDRIQWIAAVPNGFYRAKIEAAGKDR